ncbi:phosphopantetheinyl transferase [Aeromonas taiwanensis]|uniref:Enterobactin synthase component D n=1 Tax=Aeromonas taiwanensis TaxID=633417 RepID=A0A5F0K9Q8_9GAMM|nr:4'-phosphopantetheinyl transferase superfamily protein [Aeromonas taiwanensis]TFF74152.1 phosphopantetheinyl transferase [Aeromonas taiwanensis]TFF76629.1 phosphopantetheinyl transferase [Aeromonas taiwanensis]TFF78348.1 phosphopantetheinyl transferase [Aeromonas taiwanensis]
MLPRCPSFGGSFVRQSDALFMPGRADIPLYRICFDPAAFSPDSFGEQGITLPPSLQGAAPKRLGEFLAGRLAAREALRPFGLAGCCVVIGVAREPLWPTGLEGSISHSVLAGEGVALCAVRLGKGGLGLDLEAWLEEAQARTLWPGIVDEEEWGRLEASARAVGLSRAEGLTLVFSAKESLFKGLYPRVGRYFDFLDARWLAMTAQTLTLELNIPLTPALPARWRATLHWQALPGGVISLLAL